MFPKQKRLKRSEFAPSLKSGKRLSSINFTAILPKKAEGYAVIVSKKTARMSVTRHRIKRAVFEALKSFSPKIPPSIILFPKPHVSEMKYQEIKEELADILSKIGR